MKERRNSFSLFKSELPSISFYSALVVDDYGPAKKMLGANLSTIPQIGFIDYADSGEEALLKVKTIKFDLIFLDVTMPGLDGYETCELIRRIKGYEFTPIIMVSGNTLTASEFKAASSGYTSFVKKPIQQEPFRKLNLKMLDWLDTLQAA